MNTFINKCRKKINEPPIIELELSEALLTSTGGFYNSNPEEILGNKSLDKEIKKALESLHGDIRTVLWLSDLQGFT